MTEIVKMTKNHIKAVCEIENISFPDPWSESAFESEIENESAVFLTAVEGDKAVGYLGFHYALDEGYIALVATHPNHRKKGIGRKLMREAEKKARELNLAFLSLEVRVSNETAQKLYLSCGYENLGRRPNFYQTPKEDAYIMTKYL